MPLSSGSSSSTAARILVTGYADLSAVVRAVNDGRIFAYVTKPWTPDDLVMKVTKAAQHFRLTAALTHERQLLNRVLDSMQEGVIAIDRSGAVLLMKPQAELILGYWWQLAAATVFMATFVTAFSLMADAARDALDPKLRGLE